MAEELSSVITPETDIERRILEFGDWDKQNRETFSSNLIKEEDKRDNFIKKFGLRGAIKRRNSYEIARQSFLKEASTELAITAVNRRIDDAKDDELFTLKKQLCIKYYESEIAPIIEERKGYQESIDRKIKQIEDNYEEYSNEENEEKRNRIIEKTKGIDESIEQLEQLIKESDENINEKKSKLEKMQYWSSDDVRNYLKGKIEKVKEKVDIRKKENVLNLIPANIEFERIDNISSLLQYYAKLCEKASNVSIDIDSGLLVDSAYRSVFGGTSIIDYSILNSNRSFKLVITPEVFNYIEKYGYNYYLQLYETIKGLIDKDCIRIFFKPTEQEKINRCDENCSEYHSMQKMYNLCGTERKDRLLKINKLGNRITKAKNMPHIFGKRLGNAYIESLVKAYDNEKEYVRMEIYLKIKGILDKLGIPELSEYFDKIACICSSNEELLEAGLPKAEEKLNVMKNITEQIQKAYQEKVIPILVEKRLVIKQIYKEIGLEVEKEDINTGKYRIPILSSRDRIANLKAIAAAQQNPYVTEREQRMQEIDEEIARSQTDIKNSTTKNEDYESRLCDEYSKIQNYTSDESTHFSLR